MGDSSGAAAAEQGGRTDQGGIREQREGLLLEAVPALSYLAAAAAVADLVVNRVLLRGLAGSVSHGTLVTIKRWGGLPQNLAAIAGLIALGIALFGFLRMRRMPMPRRVVLAAFAGIFLPTTVLATIMPPEETSTRVLVFGAGAAHVLAVFLGVSAVRWRAPLPLRTGIGLVAASAFFALGALVITAVIPLLLELVAPRAHWHTADQVARPLRHIGEIGYLLAPIGFALHVIPRQRVGRALASWLLASAGLAGVVTAVIYGGLQLEGAFDVILYGAQGVELLLGQASMAYAAPLGLAAGAALGALVSTSPVHRQTGAGLLLILTGGYAARPPGELLMLVLGTALLSRATMAAGERRDAARAPAQASMRQVEQELEEAPEGDIEDAETQRPSAPQ